MRAFQGNGTGQTESGAGAMNTELKTKGETGARSFSNMSNVRAGQ